MEANVKIYNDKGEERNVHNLTVTLGRNLNADNWIGRDNVSGLSTSSCWTAVGYSGGTTLSAMSGLVLEAPYVSGGRLQPTSVVRADTGSQITITSIFTGASGVGPLQESALFTTAYDTDELTVLEAGSSANTGAMFARCTFSLFNKAESDVLTLEWRIIL